MISRLSVIICTWNRAALLKETLTSIQAARRPASASVEVVVVDNNSGDNTADIVRGAQLNWPHGELAYVFEGRQGKQFALNTGIRHSTGDAIAFTDDDVRVDPAWLMNIVEVLNSSRAGLVGGITRVEWPSDRPSWYSPRMSAVTGEYDLGPTPIEPAPPEFVPAGNNCIVRKEIIDKIGYYSEAHFRHMDYEFGMRARTAGVLTRYEPSLVVTTGVPKGAASKRYFRRWTFKMGIALALSDSGQAPRLFGAPRWAWRRLSADALRMIGKGLLRSEDAFAAELDAVKAMGIIACHWHSRLRPSRHAAWVSKWSQKKNDSF
jgi:glycosyltransferase involved in cell wall biosynthesis